MKDENRFTGGKAKSAHNLSRIKAPHFCWVLALWLLAACAPQALPPPPLNIYPSRVVTSDGMGFMVHRFRLPGTRQEITLRYDGTKQWIPLNLLQSVRFTGPLKDGYRQAEIILTSGERMKAEVYVNTVVEGSTDLGYWNMSLSRVDRLDLGSD
jgi:hypothetical protein